MTAVEGVGGILDGVRYLTVPPVDGERLDGVGETGGDVDGRAQLKLRLAEAEELPPVAAVNGGARLVLGRQPPGSPRKSEQEEQRPGYRG